MNILLNIGLDDELKNQILYFVDNSDSSLWRQNNVENTINRKFCNTSETIHPIKFLLEDYRQRLLKNLGFVNVERENLLGNFIGVNGEGGNVHPHMDPTNDKDWDHVRFNFLVSKPLSGGSPVVRGVEYDVCEGGCWINIASKWLHSSTPVKGPKKRVVLSIGSYIDPLEVNTFLERNKINA